MTDNEIINRQKAEIDILIRKKEALQDKVAEQQAEIEKLNTSFDVVKQEYADMFSANRNLMAEIERLNRALVIQEKQHELKMRLSKRK